MIKLIASDMDGTLLDDRKQLPKDFFYVLDRLCEKGVRFAVSSGRTYNAVEHLFPEEYRGRMDYICDNGACVIHDGRPVSVTPLERDVFNALLDECERIKGLKVLVCASSATYHLSDPEFDDEIVKFYKNHVALDNLRDVHDTIYKLAICDKQGAMERAKPALDKVFGDRLNVQVSGPIWMDVMAGGVSKGAALESLQKTLGVSKSETMAFGDYFNDVTMLMRAEHSFCMENGHDDVKKLCAHVAPTNNEGGVTKMIRKHVLGEEI